MRALLITDGANDDLGDIAEYVADQSGSRAVAEDLVAKLYRRCERLAILPGTLGTARPDLGRPDLGDDLRSVPESGFVIFFRYRDTEVQIINILHGSRDIISFYDTGDHA